MKAIIVDFDGNYLIVATKRGDFKRIYNNYPGCQVGDEIEVHRRKPFSFNSINSWVYSKKIMVGVACLLIMITASYSVVGYARPVTFVTMDINPSVELLLNKYDYVLKARGLNENGNIIIGDGRALRNLTLKNALNMLISRAKDFQYLNKEQNTVMITVSNINDHVSQIEEQIKEIVTEEINSETQSSQDINTNVIRESNETKIENDHSLNVIVENTTIKKHQEAKQMNISQGRLVLYEKLKEIKPEATLNHIKEASVAQILHEIMEEKLVNYEDIDKKEGNDKRQSLQDVKVFEKGTKDQLKNLEKETKKYLKSIEKDIGNRDKEVKEILKDVEKDLKEEFKQKRESLKEREKIIKQQQKAGQKKLKEHQKDINKKQKEQQKDVKKKLKEQVKEK
ncbi:MAG TPA: anti-sigma factor domain-containing protein [Thermoanaerobacterales bacterium]|nr:anti-sigma factor domain-containing protein [Thermoanaerobacterales bacterium]